jgi:hypothetical protein
MLFEQYSWEYNYIARKWVAPNGCEISADQIMEATAAREGDMALMRLIVENGRRQ